MCIYKRIAENANLFVDRVGSENRGGIPSLLYKCISLKSIPTEYRLSVERCLREVAHMKLPTRDGVHTVNSNRSTVNKKLPAENSVCRENYRLGNIG